MNRATVSTRIMVTGMKATGMKATGTIEVTGETWITETRSEN